MHDTGGHTSSSDTSSHTSSDTSSHSSHTVHASHSPAWEQAGSPYPVLNPGDPANYYGASSYYGSSPRRGGGVSIAVLLAILASALLPIVFALIAFTTH